MHVDKILGIRGTARDTTLQERTNKPRRDADKTERNTEGTEGRERKRRKGEKEEQEEAEPSKKMATHSSKELKTLPLNI